MFAVLIISLLLLSHVLTDFVFQTDQLVKQKKESKVAILKHTSHFFLSSFVLTIVFFNLQLLFIIALISVSHFLIDFFKIYFDDVDKQLKTFLLLITDQLLHIVVILSCYPFFTRLEPNNYINKIVNKINSNYPLLEQLNNINLLSYLVLALAGFLFIFKGGTILSLMIILLPLEKGNKIQKVNESLYNEEIAASLEQGSTISESTKERFVTGEGKKKYGKIIGVIERIIIMTAMLINKFELIAIVTAVKSIGRFKELNDKTSDYYIIGTFASFAIAIIIGGILIVLKKMLLE